jgi:hypothetical protein
MTTDHAGYLCPDCGERHGCQTPTIAAYRAAAQEAATAVIRLTTEIDAVEDVADKALETLTRLAATHQDNQLDLYGRVAALRRALSEGGGGEATNEHH